MPEGAKSFWQSIPGMMTATAGFLSAATGLLVGLNQTGVVNLKELAGKPAAQTTPANQAAPSAATPAQFTSGGPTTLDKASEPGINASVHSGDERTPQKTGAASGEASPKTNESSTMKNAPAGAVKDSVQPVVEPTRRTAEGDASIRSTPSSSEPAKPAPSKSVESGKPGSEPPPPPAEPKASAPGATPTGPSRTPDTTKLPPPPTSTGPSVPKPAPSMPSKSAETRQVAPVAVPPPPPVQDKLPPDRPDSRERVATARNARTGAPDDDPRKPRVLRPDEAITASKGKDIVADPKQGASRGASGQLDLTGLKLTIPAGWVKEELQPSPMGPVAEFKIPNPDARDADGTVRVTHFLGAKGKEMEERTIERWLSQVTRPDGAPLTRADAKIASAQLGGVRVTTVDVAGTLKPSPRETPQPGQRMLAAIIDHPRGAHLVVVDGPTSLMSKWAPTIDAFFKSAKPE